MVQKIINFENVIKYFKGFTHQVEALKYLAASLTEEQITGFYSKWYGDTIRPDDVPTIQSKSNFDLAYKFTEQWEGGFVDHPFDPGGTTNFGIIQSTYDHWRRNNGLPKQSVYYMPQSEAIDLYYTYYWLEGKCDLFGLPLNIVHFDTCVNFGVYGASLFLQEQSGVIADGRIGEITLGAVKAMSSRDLAYQIIKARIDYRYLRVNQNPTQNIFLEGWLNRDRDLEKYIASVCKTSQCD